MAASKRLFNINASEIMVNASRFALYFYWFLRSTSLITVLNHKTKKYLGIILSLLLCIFLKYSGDSDFLDTPTIFVYFNIVLIDVVVFTLALQVRGPVFESWHNSDNFCH